MRLSSLAFLAGTSLILLLRVLPKIEWAWVLLLSSLLLLIFLSKRFLVWVKYFLVATLGFAWVLLHADHQLRWVLPDQFENQTITALGTIAAIPEIKNNNATLVFAVNQLKLNPNQEFDRPALVRLSWYGVSQQLQVGDQWQLTVRLKKPRGFWDEGTFDYQKWLFGQGIRATGYVVIKGPNIFKGSQPILYFVDRTRQHLANQIAKSLANRPLTGLITALAVGVRDNITEEQWATLRGTGTNHLFAIAGLHIGLVTGMVYFLVGFIWPRVGRLAIYYPTPQIAALCALVIAVIYSALAGFSLPTQRAVIMTTVFLTTVLLRKNIAPWTAWCVAILIILILDPLAVMADSFWLSFAAVAFIIYGMGGRLTVKGLWWHWGRTQWVMTIGLIPLGLLFFQQTSLAGFIANVIAIPWVGFVVLPMTLLGDLTAALSPLISTWLWLGAEQMLALVWPLLTRIATQQKLQWHATLSCNWILFAALIAVILLLAPRRIFGRWLATVWLLPLFFWYPSTPRANEVWFTLLDVGQGLAAVIRTQHHVLIYDTGPKFNPHFDTGNAVIIPFLDSVGISKIDLLMVSHKDNDHIGGAASILAAMPLTQISTSVPDRFKPRVATLCAQGQSWQWDGVLFRVLYPPVGKDNLDNDSSCVLRIDVGTQSILLTGDIEHKSEQYLLQTEHNLLASTILIAPHHGSKTSSTLDFVSAIHPHWVLFPVGYQNRYGFPDSEVLARYKNLSSAEYSTAEDGSIDFILSQNTALRPLTYRNDKRHFWDQ